MKLNFDIIYVLWIWQGGDMIKVCNSDFSLKKTAIQGIKSLGKRSIA